MKSKKNVGIVVLLLVLLLALALFACEKDNSEIYNQSSDILDDKNKADEETDNDVSNDSCSDEDGSLDNEILDSVDAYFFKWILYKDYSCEIEVYSNVIEQDMLSEMV